MDTAQLAALNLNEEYSAGRRDFERIDLREQSLCDLQLMDTRFCWADMTSAIMARVRLDRADLTGAMMWRANLMGAGLLWTNLHQAVMVRCEAMGANLSGANLHRTDLRLADLRSVCLAGADLRGAKLCYSDLHGANLTGADLTGADLTGAKLIGACLESVCWHSAVVSPEQSIDMSGDSSASAERPQPKFDWVVSQPESDSAADETATRKRSLSAV